MHDAVGDPEVQQLLVGLGRADDAASALVVLGRYAGKVKQAKEAVVKMVGTLSPWQARKVMVDVMLPPEAGVAMQIAALRMIGDLNIPKPLELYTMAWSGGACHRDIAANILSRLATSPAVHWAPADVREFFDFFQLTDREEDRSYVADEFLEQLSVCQQWSLHFLPRLVEQLVMLPGSTRKAITALQKTTANVTEVVGALTRISATLRMAARAQGAVHPKVASNSPEAQVITDLAATSQNFTGIIHMSLEHCELSVLRHFVLDQLRVHREMTKKEQHHSLSSVLRVWVRLLRIEDLAAWPMVLEEMEAKLSQSGEPADLSVLACEVVHHVRHLPFTVEGKGAAIAAIRGLFERILDDTLSMPTQEGPEQDEQCKSERKRKIQAANEIVTKHWSLLLSTGCSSEESSRLFARCPERFRTELARVIVDGAVQASKHVAKFAPVEDVARRALAWLSSPLEVRDQHLSTLIDLWAKVVAREKEAGAFSVGLQLLGASLPPRACPGVVDALLTEQPSTVLLREALSWLSKVSPEAAVDRWPSLLASSDTVEAEDVKSMLQVCEAESLPPPELPPVVAKVLSDEVLQLYAHSGMPEARVIALQVLERRNCDAGELEVIDGLCADTCEVVKVAARHLKTTLYGDSASHRPCTRTPLSC